MEDTSTILYVTHNRIRDLLNDSIDMKGVKKICGETFSLKEFIKRSMPLYSNCNQIVIDRTVFREDDIEFANQIQILTSIYFSIQVIVINTNANDSFVRLMIRHNIYEVVTENSIEEMKIHLLKCMRHEVQEIFWENKFDAVYKEYDTIIRRNKPIKIYVYGSQSRTGVSTTALGIAEIFAEQKAKILYLETALSNISVLVNQLSLPVVNGTVSYNNIDFSIQIPFDKDYEFIIIDGGTIPPAQDFNGLKILCAGFNPTEEVFTKNCLQQEHPHLIVANFLSNQRQNYVSNYYNNYQILYPRYAPSSITEKNSLNKDIYTQICLKSLSQLN